jgi:nardilysin
VRREGLEEALKRFAQFFTSPLLKKSCINREVEAVDSEYFQATQDDTESLNQLMCHFARNGHPANKFFWGNEKSLKQQPKKNGIDVGAALRDFYRKHYSAQFMSLAVVSCDPLDVIEGYVKEAFSAVPNNGSPPVSFAMQPLPYNADVFGKIHKVLPVKDVRELHLTWQLPPLMDQYMVKPLHFLGSLVGHEGKGSLLSLLKKRDLALGLIAGNGGSGVEYNTNYSVFSIGLSLTEYGNEHIFECCVFVFQYLQMIQQAPVEDMHRYYEEMQTIELNEFNYKEKEDPEDYVCDVAEAMQVYPLEHYLTGDTLMFEFNEKVISDVAKQLTPEHALIFWMSKSHKTDVTWSVEPWFQTHFKSEAIPPKWMERIKQMEIPKRLYFPHPDSLIVVPADWMETSEQMEIAESLHFPHPNPFIATDFSLKSPDVPSTPTPTIIAENKHFKVWHKKDEHFRVPKAWYYLHMMSPVIYQSPENSVCTDLFIRILLRNLAEEIYDADCALLYYSIKMSRLNTGLVVKVSGFNHKLRNLFDMIMQAMGKFAVTEKVFEAEKEHLKKKYHNTLLKPKKLARMYRLNILEQPCHTVASKFSTIDSISCLKLQEFVHQFLSQVFVEALFQGNVTAAEALQAMEHMRCTIDYSPVEQAVIKEVSVSKLPRNSEFIVHQQSFDTSSPNTAIVIYHQFCSGTIRGLTMNDLLEQCLNEPLFDTLRTKEQLGYDVYCCCHNTSGILGLSFNVVTQVNKFT